MEITPPPHKHSQVQLIHTFFLPIFTAHTHQNLIDLTLTTPLQDECIYQTSLDIINEMLQLRLKDVSETERQATNKDR